MAVGDQGALRVEGEGGAGEPRRIPVLHHHQRDRVLVGVRDGAIVDVRGERQVVLPIHGRVELGPEPGDGGGVPILPRVGKILLQATRLAHGLGVGVLQAFHLRLEVLFFLLQRVGAGQEHGDLQITLVSTPPLQAAEAARHQQEEREQDLGGVAEGLGLLRDLHCHADRGARAGFPPLGRHGGSRVGGPPRGLLGRRGRDDIALQDVELKGRAFGAALDHIPIGKNHVPGDLLAVDEGAVLALLVLQDVVRSALHDRGMARRCVEVTFGVEANVGQGVAADPDVGLGDAFHLPGAAAGQELT